MSGVTLTLTLTPPTVHITLSLHISVGRVTFNMPYIVYYKLRSLQVIITLQYYCQCRVKYYFLHNFLDTFNKMPK